MHARSKGKKQPASRRPARPGPPCLPRQRPATPPNAWNTSARVQLDHNARGGGGRGAGVSRQRARAPACSLLPLAPSSLPSVCGLRCSALPPSLPPPPKDSPPPPCRPGTVSGRPSPRPLRRCKRGPRCRWEWWWAGGGERRERAFGHPTRGRERGGKKTQHPRSFSVHSHGHRVVAHVRRLDAGQQVGHQLGERGGGRRRPGAEKLWGGRERRRERVRAPDRSREVFSMCVCPPPAAPPAPGHAPVKPSHPRLALPVWEALGCGWRGGARCRGGR